jgi:beta-N-acetylhexosaminidase
VLSPAERDFFAATRPWGFILFKRNCDAPDQVRALTAALRQAVGRSEAPVLIDQEGGRVQRLVPPQWRKRPAAAVFGRLAEIDATAAREACRLNARLIAAELRDLSIDVDCLPCLDLRTPESHDAIGDRSFGYDADVVAELGRAAAEGLLAGGVLPVIKHLPGHGRARVDSHETLPAIESDMATLAETDFAPFRSLADLPLAMTGHLLLTAVDAEAPATTSAAVIDEVIRGRIGFDGLLLTDDISMRALRGDVGERSAAALAAGCDVVLHCNGDMDEMRAVADRVAPLDGDSAERAVRALAWRRPPEAFEREAAKRRMEALLRPLGEVA